MVKAFANWRTASTNDESGTSGLLLIDKLFREMRTDLGESNKGIEENKLLGLYIIGGKPELATQTNNAISMND